MIQESTDRTMNITYNFNAPIGQHIGHVDIINAHFDKDMRMVAGPAEAVRRPQKAVFNISSPNVTFNEIHDNTHCTIHI